MDDVAQQTSAPLPVHVLRAQQTCEVTNNRVPGGTEAASNTSCGATEHAALVPLRMGPCPVEAKRRVRKEIPSTLVFRPRISGKLFVDIFAVAFQIVFDRIILVPRRPRRAATSTRQALFLALVA